MPHVHRGARRYARPVSRISIVGVPSSAASYAAGQDLAPAALRLAGLPAKLIAAGLEVHDEGDLAVQVWKPDREHPLAQNAGPATESLPRSPRTQAAATLVRPSAKPNRRSR